jgi:Uncharacterized conserved protein
MDNTNNVTKVFDFIKKCRVFYIATVEDNQPRVRPFGAIRPFGGKLYFITGDGKAIYRQLEANPKLEICTYADGEWIRITAEAEFEDNAEVSALMRENAPDSAKALRSLPPEEMEAVMKKRPGLRNMMGAPGSKQVVFYLKNATATFYSTTNENITVTF